MKLTELLLAELDREAIPTRRVLERVPEGKDDWKPHPKSMPMGYLAQLVAIMPGWIAMMIETDEFDIAKGENEPLRTNRDLLQAHEDAIARTRAALVGTTDEHLLENWKMLVHGQVVLDQPRHIAIRDSVCNHLAHHRGQLTVYLRLNDALVPSVYGPTADERGF